MSEKKTERCFKLTLLRLFNERSHWFGKWKLVVELLLKHRNHCGLSMYVAYIKILFFLNIILYNIFYIFLWYFEIPLCFFNYRPWLNKIVEMDIDLDLYNIIFMLLESASFWLALILITIVALLPDILFTVLLRAWMPNETDRCQVCV